MIPIDGAPGSQRRAIRRIGRTPVINRSVRTDSGGRSKAFLHHITDLRLEYSIGFPAPETVKAAIEAIRLFTLDLVDRLV